MASRTFSITVLGRTLEHLGTQMYKRRDVAIAELVANAWDAGATEVLIEVPDPSAYRQDTGRVSIADNGAGMSADDLDDQYLVIGRNRRDEGQEPPLPRKVMGRKGVGKLAGFGLGRQMRVETWNLDQMTDLTLDGQKLRTAGGKSKELSLEGDVTSPAPDLPFPTGTRITLSTLKHQSPIDIDGLHQALARRFSRTVRGQMLIRINGEALRELSIKFAQRFPPVASDGAEADQEELLTDGESVRWWAGFSETILPRELQGFTVLVNGKTAQAPPFFFNIESTASGQHGTKYLTGVIEADFLDTGSDDDSDRVSTDRQEIDWDEAATARLKSWGEKLSRKLLTDRVALQGKKALSAVEDDVTLKERLEMLDTPSRKKAKRFIKALGSADADPGKIVDLADTILQAFEYRQFHDYIDELDAVADDPEKLQRALSIMRGWRALESRALLEIVKGRLEVVDKFFEMIVDDAPETAHMIGQDNVHDMLGRYPWLINPDWQVYAEEKQVTKQLREWGSHDLDPADKSRYDFLALEGEGRFVVIEIKRSGHAATLADLQQLEGYAEKLRQSKPELSAIFISTAGYNLSDRTLKGWGEREDVELVTWAEVHTRVARHYEEYRSVLTGDLGGARFRRQEHEVSMTRAVVKSGSAYRTPAERLADKVARQPVVDEQSRKE